MAEFNPAIISQIPDFAPNPVEAKANTLKLQDLMDTQTLNKMKLGEAKEAQQEQETYKSILKGSDLSTDKGATEAAEKLTRAGLPDQAMKFMKERQAIKGGALDVQLKELQVRENQQTAIVGAMDYVHRSVDEYKRSNPNATPAMLDAKTQELIVPVMDQLAQERPDLIPAIDQYKRDPGSLTYTGVVTHMAKAKDGLARLKQYSEEQKGARDERRTDVSEQQANTAAVNAATAARREEAYEKELESRQKLRDPNLLDDKTLALAIPSVMADPARMYDYTPGRGAAAAPVKKQINDAIADRLTAAGMKPEDLVRLRASAKAEAKSIEKMTAQVNAISSFEDLARFNGDRLLELVDKLDDTSIPLIEGAARLAKRKVGGSEDAAEFASVLQSFQTEAARILNNPNMTGVLTEGARQDMQHVIAGDATAGQAKRIVNRIFAEMDVRKASFDKSIEAAGQAMTVTPPGVTPAAPQVTPVVPPAQFDPNNPGSGIWQ